MFRDQLRYGRNPNVVVRAADATFYAPLKWREPKLIFTCSWSDWFIEEADQHRDEMWSIIRCTPHLTYQILTKRPERIADHLPVDWGPDGYPNVWLGVSAENQYWYDIRVPLLMHVPAKVHFVSAEPLLKPINIMATECPQLPQWIICGGESGGRPGHPPRPMNLDWARALRDQCGATDTPYFLKQLGGVRPGGSALLDGREWRQMPT